MCLQAIVSPNIAITAYSQEMLPKLAGWSDVCVCVCVCVWEGQAEASCQTTNKISGTDPAILKGGVQVLVGNVTTRTAFRKHILYNLLTQ